MQFHAVLLELFEITQANLWTSKTWPHKSVNAFFYKIDRMLPSGVYFLRYIPPTDINETAEFWPILRYV